MPITDDEAKRLIELIEKSIDEVASDPRMRGITELIFQWKADVEAGRSIERKLSARRAGGFESLADEESSRATRAGEFVGKRDYSSVEQLDMLVGALGLAFLAPSMMSKRLLDTIALHGREQGQDARPEAVVHFLEGATTDTPPKSLTISREAVVQSYESTKELANLLNAIIQEGDGDLTPMTFFKVEEVA